MITDLQKPPFDKLVSFIKPFDADSTDADYTGYKGECGDDHLIMEVKEWQLFRRRLIFRKIS